MGLPDDDYIEPLPSRAERMSRRKEYQAELDKHRQDR